MDPEWRAFGRARFLVAALPRLEAPRRNAVYDEILAAITGMPDESTRRDILSLLARNGDPARFEDVVRQIEAEPDPYERGLMAGFVIGHAPEALRDRLVDAALAGIGEIAASDDDSVTERIEAVGSRMMAYIGDPRQGLHLVSRFASDSWKRAALLEYAQSGRTELLDESLAVARDLSDPGDRATVLTAFAVAAPNDRRAAILGEALEAAMYDHSDLLHDDVMADLGRALESLPTAAVSALWRTQRARLGELARPELLRKLHGLAPAILHADPELALATVDAVLDVQRWWP
jgi:hypothetical protein